MSEIQQANDALALMGIKLTPMAEMYASLHAHYEDLVAAYEDLLARRELARPVLEYVSRGRGFVDVEPYPDAAARQALGVL